MDFQNMENDRFCKSLIICTLIKWWVFGMDTNIHIQALPIITAITSLTLKNYDKHPIITIIYNEPYLICLVVKRRDI